MSPTSGKTASSSLSGVVFRSSAALVGDVAQGEAERLGADLGVTRVDADGVVVPLLRPVLGRLLERMFGPPSEAYSPSPEASDAASGDLE